MKLLNLLTKSGGVVQFKYVIAHMVTNLKKRK